VLIRADFVYSRSGFPKENMCGRRRKAAQCPERRSIDAVQAIQSDPQVLIDSTEFLFIMRRSNFSVTP
jgi:hypothetical protein